MGAYLSRFLLRQWPQRLTGPGRRPHERALSIRKYPCGDSSRITSRSTSELCLILLGANFPATKLFEKYKAQRQPMRTKCGVAAALVRAAVRSHAPADGLEIKGYEADDVNRHDSHQSGQAKSGSAHCVQRQRHDAAGRQKVCGRYGTRLRRRQRGDIIVDAKKVEELLGVIPEKVVDYMALPRRTRLTIFPGAKGIGEKRRCRS